jgi:hypothetical protein
MKTTKVISMAKFAKEVEKIAVQQVRKYYTVQAEVGKHLHADGTTTDRIEFKAYMDGLGFFEGKTPNECLTKIKERISPKKSIIEDVLV